MSIEILDPSHESDQRAFSPARRLDTLKGATIGIISNGKKGTRPFFAAIEKEFVERHGVGKVVLLTKSNYSAPAEADIVDQAKQWKAVIAGVGD